ncbi:MAG: hypothetical protein Kow0032_07600 [Methyloligellaceae bacterium]
MIRRRLAAFFRNPWLQDILALAAMTAMVPAMLALWIAFAGISGSIQ